MMMMMMKGMAREGGALCQYALRSNTTSSSFIAYSIHITPQKVFLRGLTPPSRIALEIPVFRLKEFTFETPRPLYFPTTFRSVAMNST